MFNRIKCLWWTLLIINVVCAQEQCILDEYKELIVESDQSEKDCAVDEYYKESIDGCLPGCLKKIGIGLQCDRNGADFQQCPPGLLCGMNNRCQIDYASCFKYKHIPGTTLWPPSCTPDGKWEAKQCKGDRMSGRCFCSSDTGKRIYGLAWAKDAEDMTCACSRRREELKQQGKWYISLHCDGMGNFEPLQCDVTEDVCWCADPETGDVTSTAVPEKMMQTLHCYNDTMNGERYLRQCESLEFAYATNRRELGLHGTTYVEFPHLVCDADGTYGPYQKLSIGIIYCRWKDNKNIDPWQADTTQSVEDINCNCARDSKYYELAGLTFTLSCEPNGNYKLLQRVSSGEFYCVDNDGFSTTGLSPDVIECSNYLPYAKEQLFVRNLFNSTDVPCHGADCEPSTMITNN